MSSRPMAIDRRSLGDEEYRQSPAWFAASIALAVLFSAGLLVGLSFAQKNTKPSSPSLPEDLRAVVSPPPPPLPPPLASSSAVAMEDAPAPLDLTLESVESSLPDAVHVTAAPVAAIAEPDVDLKIALQPGAFKPKAGQGGLGIDLHRVYERTEVDQPVLALHKVAPSVHTDLLKNTKGRRVLLLFAVGTDGVPADIHVLQSVTPAVDALVIEAVSQWSFRPARKNRKAVQQWVQLPIVLNEGSGNPLSLR